MPKEVKTPKIPGFERLEFIGEGATSKVYKAFSGNKPFAIKLLNKTTQNSSLAATLAFRRTSAVLAGMTHPNVVKVLEIGEFEESPYLVMELVEGRALSKVLAEQDHLNAEDFLKFAIPLTSALGVVHSHNLVHRDIKPENIIIQNDYSPKLFDFGFALDISSSEEKKQNEDWQGTVLYSAPEQTGMLEQPIDTRSDLYGLGCLFYHCLTGKPPYLAKTFADLMDLHLKGVIPNILSTQPQSSPVLALIVAKLMAKDPDDRYQSAEALPDVPCP
jgi:serine/threonine protein kinase